VKKIALIGGPCSGKTVLAQNLNVALKMKGLESRFVEEYPTDYIMACGKPENFMEQALIFYGQIEKEKRYEKLNPDYLVLDYAAFAALVYFELMTRNAVLSEEERKKYFNCHDLLVARAREHAKTYEYIFLADPRDIVFKKDSVRFQASKDEALMIHSMIEQWMVKNHVPYHPVSGSLDQRTELILRVLNPNN
jgi:nicotinamide riboside kinase